VKTNGGLRIAACAVALCGALAAHAAPMAAAPVCAALASTPSWLDCAAEFSAGEAGAGVVFDEPFQFHDHGAAAAALDFTALAVEPNGPPQVSVDAPSAVAAIPEPHTSLLMLAGLAAICFMATRRRRP
jgi:PEP-CTERM motif